MQRLEAGPIVGSDLVQPLHEKWAVDAMQEAWERVVRTSGTRAGARLKVDRP